MGTKRTQKFQRAVVGATLQDIMAKRNQKPEVRKAQGAGHQGCQGVQEDFRQASSCQESCSHCQGAEASESSEECQVCGASCRRKTINISLLENKNIIAIYVFVSANSIHA